MKILKSLFIASIFASVLISCDEDDDPVIPNQEELITTVVYTLSPAGGGDDVIFRFEDKDEEGGEAPIITNGVLVANTEYTGVLTFLDESGAEVDNVTLEIKEEDDEHQVFFVETADNISISYDDTDENGKPVGLSSKLTTTDAGMASLQIILRHKPNKSGEGVVEGNVANAGGETDIEVTFSVDVQ